MVEEFPGVEGGVPINPDVFTRLSVGDNIGFGGVRVEEGSDVELNFALGLIVTVGVDDLLSIRPFDNKTHEENKKQSEKHAMTIKSFFTIIFLLP